MRSLTPLHQSIRFRLIALGLIGLVIVLVALAAINMADSRNNAALSKQAIADRQTILDENINLRSEVLRTYVQTYAPRDQMIQVVKTKNTALARQAIMPGLGTHQAQALWLYDPSGAPVFAATGAATQADSALPNMDPAVVKALFAKETFVSFYAQTVAGTMEVQGAPLYNNLADAARSLPPQGYFLIGRPLTPTYLAEVSKSIHGDVRLVAAKDATPSASAFTRDGNISLRKQLSDHREQPVGVYEVTFKMAAMQQFYRLREQLNWFIMVVYMLTIGAYTFLLARWVLLPLGKIYRVLQNEERTAVMDLVGEQGEFGQIARMIAHFFDQQSDLTEEVSSQRETQTKLEEQAASFERINNLMVGREIRMAELKRRNLELENQLKGQQS